MGAGLPEPKFSLTEKKFPDFWAKEGGGRVLWNPSFPYQIKEYFGKNGQFILDPFPLSKVPAAVRTLDVRVVLVAASLHIPPAPQTPNGTRTRRSSFQRLICMVSLGNDAENTENHYTIDALA